MVTVFSSKDGLEEQWVREWTQIRPRVGRLLEDLVRRFATLSASYLPGTSGNTAALTQRADPLDYPSHVGDKVVAVQISRPTGGFGGVRVGAKRCLRAPRPHLKTGEARRESYVILAGQTAG